MKTEAGNIVQFPDARSVETQAAEWIMRFEDDDASPADYAEFEAWKDENEQHRETFERLAAVWGTLDRIEELKDIAAADDSAELLAGNDGFGRKAALGAIAAAILLAVGLGIFVQQWTYKHAPFEGSYHTGVGEQETIALPDGSVVELNTNSLIEVSFSRQTRDIRLLQGEAYFDVAHNKRRPFTVHAGKGSVTAVGTAFAVRLRDDKVDVTVSQGSVELFTAPTPSTPAAPRSTMPAKQPPLLEVTAGQNAIFNEKIEHLDHIEPAALKRKLSWRDGLLAFAGEPLSDVVAEISRYTDMEIEIEDAPLRELRVAGYFKVGEVDAMFEALEAMVGLEVVRVGPKHVRLLKGGQDLEPAAQRKSHNKE